MYEAQDKSLCHFVAKHVGYFSLHGTSLSPLDCLSIGYFISLSSSVVSREADLSHCQIDDSGVKYLTKFMCESSSPISLTQKTSPTKTSSSGLKLYLSFNGIHEDGAASIAKVLQSGSSVITLLNLCGNPIGGRGLQFIAKALITNTSLVELDLSHCLLVISEENGPVVTEMLIKNKTLKSLDLSDYEDEGMILDTGLSYIAEGLKRNSALEELRLRNVTAQGGKSLATTIATNASIALVKLSIEDIEITDDSGPTFVDMLKQNITLDRISFNSSHRLSDVGVSFIAEGLQKNTTVKSLNLYRCNITSSGAKCLAKMLKINSSLTDLHINYNPIRDEGVAHLAQALKTNKTLTHLSMNSCKITDAGVSSLTDSVLMNSTLRWLSLYNNSALTKEGVKPLLDVASRKSGRVHVDNDLQQHSSSVQKPRHTGLDETSR